MEFGLSIKRHGLYIVIGLTGTGRELYQIYRKKLQREEIGWLVYL